ncbi:hypothetical protein WT39_18515 [Burkholderia territorii]|nr:hypothetical protein WT39_18515 [Burkholderia territorii]
MRHSLGAPASNRFARKFKRAFHSRSGRDARTSRRSTSDRRPIDVRSMEERYAVAPEARGGTVRARLQ